jgi:hypothetical protein
MDGWHRLTADGVLKVGFSANDLQRIRRDDAQALLPP